ncbi:MAG: lactonase family protein [Chthoniobacteraceae bacterium]
MKFIAALLALSTVVLAEPISFYIGSTGKAPETQGIYRFTLNIETGALSAPVMAADAKRASFLAVHPGGEFLYTTAEGSPGAVAAYAIGEDGSLKLLNQQSTGGAGPTHVWVDGGGANLLVANYGGGSVACLPIKEDGSLGASTAFVQHTGSSVNPQRQKEPHAHGIYSDAEDKFVYVPDLGIDKVLIYKFDPAKGTLVPNDPPAAIIAPGGGPRHFALNPTGGFAYVNNELNSTIDVFKHDAETGALEPLQTIPTLPPDFSGQNSTAEIFVHPNGRFVYCSNRGHDSIAVFAVSEGTGRLRPIDHTPTGGKTPRNFSIDPTGKWLIAANQASDDIFVFRLDPATGKLTATGQSAKLPGPMSVLFLPRK